MILSQFEEAVWHRRGSDCDIAEAWHHGGEIVSAIKAVLEFGEVTGYMLVADGAVSASDSALDVAEGGVDPLKAGFRAVLRPDPVMIGWWTQPALPTPVKQCRPSLTTVLAGWKLRCAKVAISARRKPFTRRNFKRMGLPSGVVSTEATIGVLPGAPRPRLPPLRSPPR